MKKFPLGRITLPADTYRKAGILFDLGFRRDAQPLANTISFRRPSKTRWDIPTHAYLDDVVEFRLSNVLENVTVGYQEADVDLVIDSDAETICELAQKLGLDYIAAILSPHGGDIKE